MRNTTGICQCGLEAISMRSSFILPLFLILMLVALHPVAIIYMCIVWHPYAWFVVTLNFLPYVCFVYKVYRERLKLEADVAENPIDSRPAEVVLEEYLSLMASKRKKS
jgi:hypothetical protein